MMATSISRFKLGTFPNYTPSCFEEERLLVPVKVKILSRGKETAQYELVADLSDTIDTFKRHIFCVLHIKGELFFKHTPLDPVGKDSLLSHGIYENSELVLSADRVPKSYKNKGVVTVLSGIRELKVHVGPDIFLVEDLKHMLQDEHRIKPKEVLILYNGQVVVDDHPLNLKELTKSIGGSKLQVVRHRLQLQLTKLHSRDVLNQVEKLENVSKPSMGCSINWDDKCLDYRPSPQGLTMLVETADFISLWKRVLRLLGVSDGDIVCIEKANPSDPREQAYQGLTKWIQQQWESSTWKRICQALEKLRMAQLALKVYKLASDPENSTGSSVDLINSEQVSAPVEETNRCSSGETGRIMAHTAVKKSSKSLLCAAETTALNYDATKPASVIEHCTMSRESKESEISSLDTGKINDFGFMWNGKQKQTNVVSKQLPQVNRSQGSGAIGDPMSVTMWDLADISEYLCPLASRADAGEKIYKIGIRLGLCPATVKDLRDSAAEDLNHYLHQVIVAWLKNEDHARSQTWATLIKALHSRGVDEEGIAREMEANKGLESYMRLRASSVNQDAAKILSTVKGSNMERNIT